MVIVAASITLAVVPKRFFAKSKVLKSAQSRIHKVIWRFWELSMQGPFVRLFVVCGRRCGRGRLASRCGAPSQLKAAALSCEQVRVSWIPHKVSNPFHEERYELAWQYVEESVADDGCWHNAEADCDNEKGSRLLRTWVVGLRHQAEVRIRVRAFNAHGVGPWSKEAQVRTLAQPTAEHGLEGPLGPAGHCCGGHYTWAQTSSELTLKVPLRAGWKSKDIRFKATPSKLEILFIPPPSVPGGQAAEPQELLVGSFPHKVNAEEACWEMDAGDAAQKFLVVELKKADEDVVWPCLLVGTGHPRIDTRLVRFDE